MEPKWLTVARRLQAIAQAGLTYSQDKYERERFQEIQDISIEIMKDYTEMEEEKIRELFIKEEGYPTPKVDVRAVIFKEKKLLLVKEKIDGLWSLPGGWADAHKSLKENLIQEAKEEAGVLIIPKRIIAVIDRKRYNLPPSVFGIYKVFVECMYITGSFQDNTETSAAGFFREDDLPPLSLGRNTLDQIKMCFRSQEEKVLEPSFD